MDFSEPEGFMGPPDHLHALRFEIAAKVLFVEDEQPYLFRIGGYYVWWNGNWLRDGSIPIDAHQVRRLLWMSGGKFECLED